MVLRPLLTLTCLLFILLVGLTLLASKLGSLQPPNPALVGFVEGCEDKPQPCWYGIVPGITDAAVASDILHELGYYEVETTYYMTSGQFDFISNVPNCTMSIDFDLDGLFTIETLRFRKCQNLQLGDLIQIFGKPDQFDVCTPNPIIAPAVQYASGVLLDLSWVLPSPTPFYAVEEMSLIPDDWIGRDETPWQGFAPYWSYRVRDLDSNCFE